MFFRNVLLVLGGLCIVAGMALAYLWLGGPASSTDAPRQETPEPQPTQMAVLSAVRDIVAGSLLQQGDVAWKDIASSELRPGNLVRGQASEAEFVGALAKRDFASGEALVASDVVKLNDRRFLAAALKPGSRAISIAVDAAQSASGLVMPGNHVDGILTQSLGDPAGEGKWKIVAETILQNIRVIAVDQTLNQQPKAQAAPQLFTEPHFPKTVTLELTGRQAEMVFVALQLGSLQLSVRPIENAEEKPGPKAESAQSAPTWAYDVSPALKQTAPKLPQTTASTLESAVRRPPAS